MPGRSTRSCILVRCARRSCKILLLLRATAAERSHLRHLQIQSCHNLVSCSHHSRPRRPRRLPAFAETVKKKRKKKEKPLGLVQVRTCLEELGGLRIVFVDIRMILLCQLIIGLFDVLSRGVPGDAEHLVVVFGCHGILGRVEELFSRQEWGGRASEGNSGHREKIAIFFLTYIKLFISCLRNYSVMSLSRPKKLCGATASECGNNGSPKDEHVGLVRSEALDGRPEELKPQR